MGCCPSTEVSEETERLVNPHETDPSMPKEWVEKYKTFLDDKDRRSRHYEPAPPHHTPTPPSAESSAKFAIDEEFRAKFQNWHPKPPH
jgi:hypothetical protein